MTFPQNSRKRGKSHHHHHHHCYVLSVCFHSTGRFMQAFSLSEEEVGSCRFQNGPFPCCADEGEKDTDEFARVLTQEN